MNGNSPLPPNHDASFWTVLSELAPHLFWGMLLIGLVILVGPERIREAFSSTSKIGIGGFLDVEIKRDIKEASKNRDVELSERSQAQIASRLDRNKDLLFGSRILWIDDVPRNNEIEFVILRNLGVLIDIAKDDSEAINRINAAIYNIIITDMGRGSNRNAGKNLLPDLLKAVLSPPVIFYVGAPQQVPTGAFGLATRPDQLMNLIIDALERQAPSSAGTG